MSRRAPSSGEPSGEPAPRLHDRDWPRFLKGPDPALIRDLYEPGLAVAERYDRCCAYFSSSVLAAAAGGFGPFVQRLYERLPLPPGTPPPVRLLVNEELQPADVKALTERRDTAKLEAVLAKRLVAPKDLAEKRRFELLAWLVKEGLLEVRVGLMRSGTGILHAKFGLIYDAHDDALVFAGSGNESAQGLRSSFEQVEVSCSWADPERHERFVGDFEVLWADTDPYVHTLPLPEAVRLKLVKFAPAEPPLADTAPSARRRQEAAMLWQFVASAPYLQKGGGAACDATALVDLWPHQRHVVRDAAEAWPDGRLLCDEVGMGKTIEAILALRRLVAGRGVARALLLLPAGLTRQWQGELREKGGLVWPRFENPNKLVWPDEREETATLAQALERPFLLISRETARLPENRQHLLQAEPWDLVLLDEAHAARRAHQKEGEYNNATLLLELLRRLQLDRRTRGLMLLSATPMQTHPWEPWDLLAVLGEGGAWLADFGNVRAYYGALAGLDRGFLPRDEAHVAASLIGSDPEFPPMEELRPQDVGVGEIERLLTTSSPSVRPVLARWMRRGSPLGRRMHRNTRATLRAYYQRGMLDRPPPVRTVMDERFDYEDRAERGVYDAITGYIDRRFAELEGENAGKGFVMTIYRRRAASSPRSLERSLERRADALRQVAQRHAADVLLGFDDVPEALDLDELPEELAGQVQTGLPASPAAAARELAEVEALLVRLRRLDGRDTKRERFFDVVRRLTDDGRATLVFTEYADTMDYLREHMVAYYGDALACYSGRGGEVLADGAWQIVSKAEITERLRAGRIQALLCTDAASEGLNLQAASALVNYDLPWNPSKVEQRIGRIDRIGQAEAEVRITNLFLEDSVDDRVYGVLRARCKLFEAFVGPMQPVLARARKMLLGGAHAADADELARVASEAEADQLVGEAYLESEETPGGAEAPALTRNQLRAALNALRLVEGTNVRVKGDAAELTLKRRRHRFALRPPALEADADAVPLTPLSPEVQALAESLERPGEQLPLVVRAAARGAFRAVACRWVGGEGRAVEVGSFDQLQALISSWDGTPPSPSAWQEAALRAQADADAAVEGMKQCAAERGDAALARQVEAAKLRLLRELARYLLAPDANAGDLNATWYAAMGRERADGRLRTAFGRLGNRYPDWPDALVRPLRAEVREMTEGQRKALLLGKPLDAALADPRWMATPATSRRGLGGVE